MHEIPTIRPRLWPGVLIIALMWLARLVPAVVELPQNVQFYAWFMPTAVAALALLAWWLFASRLPWADRVGLLAVFAALGAGAFLAAHGTFRFMLFLYALPVGLTAWVGWLLVTPFLGWPVRRAGLVVVVLLVCAGSAAFRLDGTTGNFTPEVSLRWSPTKEEKSQEEIDTRPSEEPAATEKVTLGPGDWPGFRGPDRDGRLTGVRIATDWKKEPPKERWRQKVGPGWSSFAVIGDRLYTQEQRGEDEVVVCYHAATGAQRWVHKDTGIRFSEAVGGPGPRATPTFHDGKVYALGAKGKLDCLDAASGKVVWSKDVKDDTGAKVPEWGFAASPLVARGIVTVYAGGPGKAVAAYKADTGDFLWASGTGGHSYCSTQLSRLGGTDMLLVATKVGLTALEPDSGKILLEYADEQKQVPRVIQPAVVSGSDVLLGAAMGQGTRRLSLSHSPGEGWSASSKWHTQAISPYFNDLVVHKDHLYGFDGVFLTCVNLDAGEGRWRARGYGNGQVLLLADQGLLVVLSEKGDVALVEASPEGHKVLGKFEALQGKTWNHPVVAHGKLFVRNGEEMACFQLRPEGK